MNNISPYKTDDSKKIQIAKMFDHISGNYDFLNSLLSLGIDRFWRKKTLQELPIDPVNQYKVLDVASGTCALSIQAVTMYPNIKIAATDISLKMLQNGFHRIEKLGFQKNIEISVEDAEHLSFSDNTFDAVMVAFGVRNFENLEAGLQEMRRVLKPHGKIVILEFSKPRKFPIKQLFNFYFKNILPIIGNLLSKDSRAYTYLFESVQHFPDYERFTAILSNIGLIKCSYKPLTFGICTIYSGYKL
ncbi:MAG: bifunctional demethylmenaquinone methyltransferase/2-methoxy-6-polyprenyl-1,4-benzoquinol methylase UbiE [Saprospiraceae bacterium]